VRGKNNKVVGIVSFTDFLQGLESLCVRSLEENSIPADSPPGTGPRPPNIFTKIVRDLGKKPVRELMLETSPTIPAGATLLEATNRLLSLNVRRLLVMEGEEVIGVIREKDIMFEMAKIIR